MRIKRQRAMTRLATAIGAGVLAVTGTTASAVAADSGPAAAPQARSVGIQSGWVETWINGNVRYGPSTEYGINYTVGAGFVSYGLCWKHGGWVNANGVAHDKWVKLSSNAWIWGGLLKGDETGGVDNYC
ncbi:hypothetical protein [Streptomyces sp. DH24]|uniref:hypothetical protein n=1 Tax=Streptomyces sp. DH24 TaxID=3040123 RepID=UPI002441F8B8|nr:hypothetical protein [Streptomyces sp. DH24]MDG9719758.1 hypothetical protein [Streptomyces sp. DH24]